MSFAFSRRAFLTGASALGATTLVAGCATNSAGTTSGDAAIKFDGEHQAGITTAQQDRMHFAAFNVVTKERSELEELLKKWTAMARRMTRGETTVMRRLRTSASTRCRRTPARPMTWSLRTSRSPLGLGLRFSTIALAWGRRVRKSSKTCRSSPATSPSRRAVTTRRWLSTPSATWRALAAESWNTSGPS